MSHAILEMLSQRLNPEFNLVEDQIAESKAPVWAQCNQLRKQGVVTQSIQPGELGRVCFQATTWFAICFHDTALPVNTSVRAFGQHNATTLIVEPILQTSLQISIIEHVS